MAKKVKLDILEKREDQHEEIEPSPVSETGDGQRPLPLWKSKKWILIGGIVLCGCLIAVGTVIFIVKTGKNDMLPMPAETAPVNTSDTIQRNLSNFDNFVVDYRDSAGNVRIVMFAFAVELNKPVNGDAIEDRTELRGAIYTLTKKKSVASLLSPEDRKEFRSEIAAELDKRLGVGVVKAVYFTKFRVL